MYPKRRAAAVAEELNKQELEQDAGDDQDEEDDKSFTEADAEPEEALKKARKDPNALPMRRKNNKVGIALSSDSDEELDASGPEGPKRFDPNCPQGKSYTRQQFIVAYGGTTEWDVAGMANASSRGVMQHQGTTSSLDRLKDQSKKRKTDAIFESMNAGDGWQHSDALGFTETHVVARSRERLKLRRRPMQVANQNDRLRARGRQRLDRVPLGINAE